MNVYASLENFSGGESAYVYMTKMDVGMDEFIYTVRMKMLTKCGAADKALSVWKEMIGNYVRPSEHTYVCAITACTQALSLSNGKQVHSHLLWSGIEPNIYLWNSLLNMYTKCNAPDQTILLWKGILPYTCVRF